MLFNQAGLPEETQDIIPVDSMSQIMEACMLENLTSEEVLEFVQNNEEVTDMIRGSEVLTEKTIIRLDKAARLSRAQKVAIFTIAKERNDPLFKKLLTLWRMERYIEAKLARKYGNEGMRRARKAVASFKPSNKTNKKVIDRVALKAKRQMNAMKDIKARQMITKLNV